MRLLAAHVRDTMAYRWRRLRRSIYLVGHSSTVVEFFSSPKLASLLPLFLALGQNSTGSSDHSLSAIELEVRRAKLTSSTHDLAALGAS